MVLQNNSGGRLGLGVGFIRENHMLGYACFRFPLRCKSSNSSAVSLTHSPCSYSYYSLQNIHRHSSSPSSSSLSSFVLFQRNNNLQHNSIETCCHLSNAKRAQHHSSSCLLAENHIGSVGATIWHALIPSSSQFSHTQQVPNVENGRIRSESNSLCNFSRNSLVGFERSSIGIYGKCDSMTCPKLPVVGGFSEGSWNATWDVRPARWLHGSHSAWLLFGVCACFSSLNPAHSEAEKVEVVAGIDGNGDNSALDYAIPAADQASHGKKVYTDYSVTAIPGDGRCLFRAVAHGACLRSGKPAPNESLQRELADELRSRVADELLKRREETEWFIEGDFDMYVEQIKRPHVWGGEPELLMASHVLQMPITVYMRERDADGLIAIAEYGQDYGKGNPVSVLYHGFGHYDALQIHND